LSWHPTTRSQSATYCEKCLILESQFPNDGFRAWIDRELDGYDKDDDVPSYRLFPARSYGMFTGLASNIASQPLNIGVMKPDDRKVIEELRLFQPASSYEGRPDKTSDAAIPWPVHLTTRYQEKFITTHTLLRAWQSLPGSVIIALLETVRNRVLRFALEMQKSSGGESSMSSENVGDIVNRQIFSGKKFDWT
jgi:hypothetical protein